MDNQRTFDDAMLDLIRREASLKSFPPSLAPLISVGAWLVLLLITAVAGLAMMMIKRR